MADLSLDEVIMKRPQITGFNKKRLGIQVSGNVRKTFDARQKLGSVSKPQQNDARFAIIQKSKFGDARNKIQVKRAGVQPNKPPIARITAPKPGEKTHDVRVKLTNSQQTKQVDARQMIKLRQQKQQISVQGQVQRPFQGQGHIQRGFQGQIQHSFQGQSQQDFQGQRHFQDQGFHGQTKVTVSGLGRVMNTQTGQGGTVFRGGNIQRIIPTKQANYTLEQGNSLIKKTVQNPHFAPISASRVGNNIVISPETLHRQSEPMYEEDYDSTPEPYYQQQHQQEYQHYQQQPTFSSQQFLDMPMIRIQNDTYQRSLHTHNPEPAPPVHHPTYYNPQPMPMAQPSYHSESQPAMQNIVAPSRSHMTVNDRYSVQASTSHTRLQSRLGDDPQASVPMEDNSPLQGYQVLISNLNHVVTQDDIVELFGVVGALKKAKLVRLGTAEVVFVRREDALAAIQKYNNRELDGQPMHVAMASNVQPPVPRSTRPNLQMEQDIARLQKAGANTAESAPIDVDINLLHKALFKTRSKDDPPSRPVTFTVKI